jgi:hypothetical protein
MLMASLEMFTQPNASEPDTTALITEALRIKFRERALDVAVMQRDLAESESLAKWEKIVERLKG